MKRPPGLVIVFGWAVLVWHSPLAGETSPSAEQIVQIVRGQRSDPRSVAQLVQLTRELDDDDAIVIFREISQEHLRNGHFNLAGDVLRQLLSQYSDHPESRASLATLLHLYSSGEVAHSQSQGRPSQSAGFAAYGMHLADRMFRTHPDWSKHPALVFQYAVSARLRGQHQTARSWLTRLKHDLEASPWRERALTEGWLQSSREENPPMPVVLCAATEKSPHLDGVLDEENEAG